MSMHFIPVSGQQVVAQFNGSSHTYPVIGAVISEFDPDGQLICSHPDGKVTPIAAIRLQPGFRSLHVESLHAEPLHGEEAKA